MWFSDSNSSWHEVAMEDLNSVAREVLGRAGGKKVWLFYGEMGSGKTTFIKALCRACGVADAMSSPTFSIVNEYRTGDDRSIYHFDFYRIRNEIEAYDIGSEEYFYSGNLCLIEWPEKIPSLIPAEHVKVSLVVEDKNLRTPGQDVIPQDQKP